MKTEIDYPEEWNQLPRHERRKKVRELRRQKEKQGRSLNKVRNIFLVILLVAASIFGFQTLTKKSPERVEFEAKVEEVSLEGKIKEFPIEGREHVSARTPVTYQTNPPTSGDHLAEAERWGVYKEEISDKEAVHGLEHGGIWITYKDLDEEGVKVLSEIGRENSGSTIVSPRSVNDNKIAIASWGRMMVLETLDKALIQKYIDTYKNQGPEKLAN